MELSVPRPSDVADENRVSSSRDRSRPRVPAGGPLSVPLRSRLALTNRPERRSLVTAPPDEPVFGIEGLSVHSEVTVPALQPSLDALRERFSSILGRVQLVVPLPLKTVQQAGDSGLHVSWEAPSVPFGAPGEYLCLVEIPARLQRAGSWAFLYVRRAATREQSLVYFVDPTADPQIRALFQRWLAARDNALNQPSTPEVANVPWPTRFCQVSTGYQPRRVWPRGLQPASVLSAIAGADRPISRLSGV